MRSDATRATIISTRSNRSRTLTIASTQIFAPLPCSPASSITEVRLKPDLSLLSFDFREADVNQDHSPAPVHVRDLNRWEMFLQTKPDDLSMFQRSTLN